MAEVLTFERGAALSPAVSDKQGCARCANDDVVAVTITSQFVYLRCANCGEVWSIPQRRKTLRFDDPKQF